MARLQRTVSAQHPVSQPHATPNIMHSTSASVDTHGYGVGAASTIPTQRARELEKERIQEERARKEKERTRQERERQRAEYLAQKNREPEVLTSNPRISRVERERTSTRPSRDERRQLQLQSQYYESDTVTAAARKRQTLTNRQEV